MQLSKEKLDGDCPFESDKYHFLIEQIDNCRKEEFKKWEKDDVFNKTRINKIKEWILSCEANAKQAKESNQDGIYLTSDAMSLAYKNCIELFTAEIEPTFLKNENI